MYVIEYADQINIDSVKTTYPCTGMSSWYLLSLRIESEQAPLARFLSFSWEDVNGSFHHIQRATKRDCLWSCSASQLPWESKPSCLQGEENVEMKKKQKRKIKKKEGAHPDSFRAVEETGSG